MKPRVLHVIDHTSSGGAQVVVEQMVRLLAPDFSFGVAVLGRPGRFSDAYRGLAIPVFELGLSYGRWSILPLLGLLRVIQRGGYELVHTHLFKSNVLGLAAAKGAGRRAILHDHSDASAQSMEERAYFPNPLVRIAYQFAYRWSIHHCEGVVVLVPQTRDYYIGTYSVDPGRIHVVPNAIDLQRLEQMGKARSRGWLRGELGVSPGTSLVAMVGRLEPEKDWGTFLRVARCVGAALGSGCTFIAVGSGSLDSSLRKLAQQLEVDNVVFLGDRDDVPGILHEVDAFLLTSRREAFGIVILEAMGSGCPVVATRSGGPASIIHDGTNGLLADVGDVEGIAHRVVRLLRDPGLRERLAHNALSAVSRHYEVGCIARMMRTIYEDTLNRELL